MGKSFFYYLETSTAKEKEEIANELKQFYNTLLDLEKDAFSRARQNKRTTKDKIRYFEIIQQIGTLQAVFEILHIDFEMGAPFEDVSAPF